MKITKNAVLKAVGGFLILAAAVAITFFATKKPQELRQKASTPRGTETILLSPSTNTLYVGQSMTVNLMVNLTGKIIDGVQVVASISGTIPSNLTYTPATVTGLDILTHGLLPTSTGKQWQLLYRTFNLKQPYTGTGFISLGTLTFTGTQPGVMTITFNSTLTKIVENQTTSDIVQQPAPGVYTFISVPTPTSTPKPTATPIPTPTPKPTTTPTSVPPKPKPIATSTPKPIPPPKQTPKPAPRCIIRWPRRPYPCILAI